VVMFVLGIYMLRSARYRAYQLFVGRLRFDVLIEKAGDFEISEEDIRSALEAAEQEARDEPGKVNAWRERWRMLFTKMGRGNR
jgi:FtsZ-binding cell division protein ZapB